MRRGGALHLSLHAQALETGWLASPVVVHALNRDAGPSKPAGYVNLNGTALFFAETAQFGAELWRSDGTTGGTHLVHDINPGTAGSVPATDASPIIILNGNGMFIARDDVHGQEVWVTDGTWNVTSVLSDLNFGPADGVEGPLVAGSNGRAYFAGAG